MLMTRLGVMVTMVAQERSITDFYLPCFEVHLFSFFSSFLFSTQRYSFNYLGCPKWGCRLHNQLSSYQSFCCCLWWVSFESKLCFCFLLTPHRFNHVPFKLKTVDLTAETKNKYISFQNIINNYESFSTNYIYCII